MSAADPYEPHVVREGESLSELATARGADPKTVWQASGNDDLRSTRCHMDLLRPLDLVYLPQAVTPSFALQMGTTNIFTSAPVSLPAYPTLILAQSATGHAMNLLVRARYPWRDPITKFVLNGQELEAQRDYVQSGREAFFHLAGATSGNLQGTLSFDAQGDYSFSLTVVGDLKSQLESIYAQSLNINRLAEILWLKKSYDPDTDATTELPQSLLLTAFYSRELIFENLGETIEAGPDWNHFVATMADMPGPPESLTGN